MKIHANRIASWMHPLVISSNSVFRATLVQAV